jgi:hypothetical protein
MKLLTDGTGKNPVLGFCLRVLAKHATDWPPTEEVLAQEFVFWLEFSPFLTREAIKELCQAKGVNVSFAPLPQDIRGLNCSFREKKEIVISEPEIAIFSDPHTLFHEFREMLEHVFTELGYPTTGTESLSEARAEHFAVLCRMKAGEKELPDLIASTQTVENRWVRYLAYTALGVLTVAYLVGCVLTPTMEEISSKSKA